MASSVVRRSPACPDRVGSPLCRPDGDALDTDVPGSSTTGAATSRATSTESARTDPPGPPGDGGGADWIPRGPDGRPTYWSSPPPDLSPAGEARRLARRGSGDLLDVIAATGDREGWPTDEVLRAQAKVREAWQRRVPPKWLDCLEKATRWVDTGPLPSPVAEARMPEWARPVLLARVSRIPRGYLPEGDASGEPRASGGARGGWSGRPKRKRGCDPGSEAPSAPLPCPPPMESAGPAALGADPGGLPPRPAGDWSAGSPAAPSLRSVKSESPTFPWSTLPGEDDLA